MTATASRSELTDELKDAIQTAYRAWLGKRDFRPRRGQRQMIAEIARALTGEAERVCVVEAGTGTGKTVAYCLAVIPIALAAGKRVVIATATVALQEQVVLRDLPDLRRNAGLAFNFALAKGRGRYLCVARLEDRISFDHAREAPLFEPPQRGDLSTYQRMRSAYERGKWDGDRDSWKDGVENRLWAPVTNDRAGCAAGRCRHYHNCAFFNARQEVGDADVVVANHDLLLADLSIGGGVVLPPPQDTIFVLDEAHHLPEKTRDHFTARVRLRASLDWLEQVANNLDTMARRFNRPREVERAAERFAKDAGEMRTLIGDVEALARQLPFDGGTARLRDAPAHERVRTHRFPLGEVPAALAELAGPLGGAYGSCGDVLESLRQALEQVLAGDLAWDNAPLAEAWLPVIANLAGRAAGGRALFQDYADGPAEAARWATQLTFDSGEDIELTTAPLDPGGILKETLWESCHGAVATSATLCAVGTFDSFLEKSGIASGAAQARISSPFDFPNIATFAVPAMRSDPRDGDAHTEEVAALLPELLELEPSALVLFTSWRQFHAVTEALPEDVRARCHLQEAASKRRLLADHRAAVDAGEPSYLCGLASFAEGLDLPGDYCRHVIIAKLPFAVPDNPVDEALAEWLEAQGRNPFFELAVPETSLRLVQACGRLIRHESDGGRISLLDRRMVTARYGESLLAALPPYRRELG